ncbi:CDP-alcohol phosphatidyltransferase family protein [Ornithinimicrobium sufpigmenti]|uniref:CDP-alcohol phosphatidyltransferase family protein n=1 Tax=Ornithinimicrobium sufpigmenti TaxID=2508882 RepID=UPI001EDD96F3|nr:MULTISPECIES: CDP-alcohol phosphatidyltransferase family protein [unclassified Ornithinimicrobium]
MNRPLGRVFAVVAFRYGLTPNQVTVVSALMTFGGLTLLTLAAPSWPAAIAVALLLVLGYALDSADGQVARLGGGGSPAGEWLDHVIDAAKAIALHAAVLIHWYRFVDLPPEILLIPVLTMVVSGTWFFAEILTQMLERLHPRDSAAERRRPAWQPVLALPADYGVQAWTFVLLALPAVFVGVYIALAALTAVMMVRQLRSWFRRVAALRPAAARPSSVSA